ncbi:L-amino acid N-acyltransferase YncA [Streptoalloteichus tenebrarius]|uniref:L-amino acid N-acyltransferase YncA n=1 Tax=Streptoalloteichus tenebrarius (strain ATCC 17920 / DSM 40477 / JCM 4838 / CBS 697.72 / NBRC 16177 / NCIMB 11028 / NRRL B-12390 / A12253. 1 / ISP 5477) TaxID=1933 RepID=A0ABT1HT82_STRSD|nr:GNAT family N-acetyltransferase [Streptoalloteichus tenebrarius]MCP2258712.1 L-amino acid N-acyltransferase YncA [Streptoalloteichus tenebrarius]BFF02860.1 GNAT family N-acetyltransferase [Streptoalloteichus tenebrarius]
MADPRVRPVRESDVEKVVELVYELAEYERARHECHLTPDQLRAALFAERPALFGHVAEVDGEVVGYALWFLNFSTWRGTHGIYLEDLYVRPGQRGSGLGRALLTELAEECVRRGYARLEWWVLDWNTPAINFYKSLGAVPMDEWTVYRVTDEALAALGAAGRA